jgi:hypothetical protein
VLLGPQRYAWGQQSLLVLGADGKREGEEGEPEASVFFDGQAWRLDDGSSVQSPECGDIVSLKSGFWRLLLPELGHGGDARTAGCELDLAQIEIRFRVSFGQLLSIAIAQGNQQLVLPARAHLNTLWELAKVRAANADSGWVSAIDLAARLRCSPEKVNVDIHRLRKLFQESGVHQAGRIIERDGAKRVRIGIEQIKWESQ